MSEKFLYNNQAVVEGEIISEFEYSHEVFGERFYHVKLKVKRLSDSVDIVPLMISERLIDVHKSYIGRYLWVNGQFRSFNRRMKHKRHLILFLFVLALELPQETSWDDANNIFLNGYLCKKPVYRITPSGREIADLLIAVNRAYGKSDYIPCISWGREAKYMDKFSVGDHIRLWGRIQSREYQKKVNQLEIKNFTVYEVSAFKIEHLEDIEDFPSEHVADSQTFPER